LLDPRVEDNAKKVKKLEEAIIALANHVEGITWRVATSEEKHSSGFIAEEILKILEKEA
jgi:hypothetical protein